MDISKKGTTAKELTVEIFIVINKKIISLF